MRFFALFLFCGLARTYVYVLLSFILFGFGQSLLPLAEYIDQLVAFAENTIEHLNGESGLLTIRTSGNQKDLVSNFCARGVHFRRIPSYLDDLVPKTIDSGYSYDSVCHRFATVVNTFFFCVCLIPMISLTVSFFFVGVGDGAHAASRGRDFVQVL